MVEYLYSHPLTFAALALLLSAAVRALPTPPDPPVGFCQGFYFWLFNFTHGVLANWDKVKRPNMIPPKPE
jgi:hypothetical protein